MPGCSKAELTAILLPFDVPRRCTRRRLRNPAGRVEVVEVGEHTVWELRRTVAPGVVADGFGAPGERLELFVPDTAV